MADPSWLINKLSNPDYNNWVKGNLILQELKTGLVLFLDDKAKDLQKYVLGHVAASSIVCTVCTGNDLRRGRYICPSAGICTTILQVINTEYIHHPPGTVKLMNTNNQAWCDTARYWEIAKAYISAPGYASKTSAAATDCAGLLTIILNCKWIQKFLLINPDVFQQVKDINNAMKHSEDNTMAADQLDKLYDCCIQILQDRHLLSVGSQTALARITEIRHLETLTAALETKLVSQPDPTVSHDTHVSSSEARNPTDRIPMTKGPGLPIEILRMDPKAVELYKTALKEGEVVDHSIRLMIIGHFDVGKTTLARRILGKPVDIQARDSTNGIDVHIHPCKVSLSDQTWHSLQPDEKIDTALKRLAKMIASRNTGEDAPTPTDETKLKTTPAKTESSVGAVGGAKQIVDVQGDEIVYIRENPETINKPSEDKEDTACKEEIKELVAETTETGTFDTGEFASVSLWDFAGQYVFYTTHQMFLSHKAVYLLVTDISKHIGDVVIEDECYVDSSGPKKCTISEFVDFWLNSIHTCFPDGPNVESTVPSVILVGTHADKLTKATVTDDANSSQRGKNREGKASDFFNDVRIHLSKKQTRFHLADEEFDIDNTVIDSKLEDLKKKIVEVAQGLPHWGKRIPAKWLRLETVLWGIKENGWKIVDFVLIKELNGAMSVPISDDELELFLQFHHDSGNILYFSGSSLKEKVVLDSKWFVDALKYLTTSKTCLKNPHVSPDWVEFSERGILRPNLIDAVWQNEKIDPSFHDNRNHLIALMEKMNVICKPMLWPKDVATPTKEEYYLAPCMLTNTPPEHLLSPSHGKDRETTSVLVFYFLMKFVPTAIFHRLLAACLSNWSLWRRGEDDLIFCGCGVFKIDKSHKLTLVFRDFTIQAFVTKVGCLDKCPKEEICIAVLDFLDKILKSVTGCLAPSSLYTLCIKCPENKNNSVDAIIPVLQFQEQKEVVCSCNDSTDHVINSVDMLKYWFPTQNQEELFPEYSMTRKPRGICVIINNKNFGKDRKTREGTDVDKKGLKNIFEKLDFIVKTYPDDRSDTEMKDILIEAQNIDHTKFDCFVCCILTHGGRGFLYGSNNKEVVITDITSKFQANRCPSLAEKPKLFFFQTCMGPHDMKGGKLETDGTQQLVETDGDRDYVPNEAAFLLEDPTDLVETDGERHSVPNMADFLFGYPTVDGYSARRNGTDGSWYISKLVQMLNKHSHNQDLMSILVKVNEEVSMKGSTNKQIPQPVVTLRKKLYFRPFAQENLS